MRTCLFPNKHHAERQPLQCDEKAKIKISHSWLATLLESNTKSCFHEQNAWKGRWNTDVTRTYVRGWRLPFHATNVQRSGGKKGLTDCTAIQCSPLAGTMEVKLICAEGRPLRFAVGIVRESSPDFHTIDQDDQVIDSFPGVVPVACSDDSKLYDGPSTCPAIVGSRPAGTTSWITRVTERELQWRHSSARFSVVCA